MSISYGQGDAACRAQTRGGAGDTVLLLAGPDRSLLPARARRLSHGALAREAACLERDRCWGAAAAFWEAAALEASGAEQAWCQARMAWCLRRSRDTLQPAERASLRARTGGGLRHACCPARSRAFAG